MSAWDHLGKQWGASFDDPDFDSVHPANQTTEDSFAAHSGGSHAPHPDNVQGPYGDVHDKTTTLNRISRTSEFSLGTAKPGLN